MADEEARRDRGGDALLEGTALDGGRRRARQARGEHGLRLEYAVQLDAQWRGIRRRPDQLFDQVVLDVTDLRDSVVVGDVEEVRELVPRHEHLAQKTETEPRDSTFIAL